MKIYTESESLTRSINSEFQKSHSLSLLSFSEHLQGRQKLEKKLKSTFLEWQENSQLQRTAMLKSTESR